MHGPGGICGLRVDLNPNLINPELEKVDRLAKDRYLPPHRVRRQGGVRSQELDHISD